MAMQMPSQPKKGSAYTQPIPVAASLRPTPSWMPRTNGLGIQRSIAPIVPVSPSVKRMAPMTIPDAINSPLARPSVIATAAIAFMGCTGMG
jgi:hypothetical protein